MGSKNYQTAQFDARAQNLCTPESGCLIAQKLSKPRKWLFDSPKVQSYETPESGHRKAIGSIKFELF